MNPLSTKRNAYYKNEKDNVIFTPIGVSEFICFVIKKYCTDKIFNTVLDPAVGGGNLLVPWFPTAKKLIGYDTEFFPVSHDIESKYTFCQQNFLGCSERRQDIDLIVLNPPFNNNEKIKAFLKEKKLGKALLPELFLEKCLDLYRIDIPIVMFCPMGFRLNQRMKSDRWRELRDHYPEITSILSLPLDVFCLSGKKVEFHNEVLFFNLPELPAHMFLPEEYLYG